MHKTSASWSADEVAVIRDEYLKTRQAHCPFDGAPLKILRDWGSREEWKLASVSCPKCGRTTSEKPGPPPAND